MTDEPLYARLGFTDAEWGLLVGLPQAVLTAAVPGLARPGALADAGPAVSLVGIAALGPRHRRLALTDLPGASAFALADWTTAP